MENEPTKGLGSAARGTLLVLIIGIAVGTVLAFVLRIPAGVFPPGVLPPPLWVTQLGVATAILSLALLLALLVVYVRNYRVTRAPFHLGLSVFLAVLFAETLVSSPLLLGAFGVGPGELTRFLDIGGVLMSAALAIFLYLSLL